MKKGSVSALAVAGCLVLAMGAVHAQTFYKWKDASGTTHYTDTPPPTGHATTVKVAGAAASAAAAASAPPSAASAASAADAPSPELMAAEAKYQKASCEAAQRDVAAVQSDAMLVDSSDPTQAKRLDESQRQDALAAARDRVKQFCGGGSGKP